MQKTEELILALSKNRVRFVFLVSNAGQLKLLNAFTGKYPTAKFVSYAFFNGQNYNFLHRAISVGKKEMRSSIDLKKIILNKLLNVDYWGKLIILPRGDVLPDMNSSVIGNIFRDSPEELVLNEVARNGSFWMKTREKEPCVSCVFQHVCPPPFNYELLSEKNTFCFKNRRER